MFRIHEPLEKEVEISGVVYPVNLAFDNVIKLLDLIKSPYHNDGEKIILGIYLLLGTELELEPDQLVKVFDSLIKNFIHDSDGDEADVDLEGNPMPTVASAPSYDLSHDASYIYTSFKQAYNITLFEVLGKLDWREFKILLRDLPDETKFKQVIDIRLRPYPKGKGNGEERKKLKELKKAFALPSNTVDD